MLVHIHRWNPFTCKFEEAWVQEAIARGMRHLGKAALAGMLTCGGAGIPPTPADAGPMSPPAHTEHRDDTGGASINRPGIPPVYGVRDIGDASPFKFQLFEPGPLPVPEHHVSCRPDMAWLTCMPPEHNHKHDVAEPGTLAILLGALALLASIVLVRIQTPIEPRMRFTILTTEK